MFSANIIYRDCCRSDSITSVAVMLVILEFYLSVLLYRDCGRPDRITSVVVILVTSEFSLLNVFS